MRTLTGILLIYLFTLDAFGQDTTGFKFQNSYEGYKNWTKPQTCLRLAVGYQKLFYTEAGISRLSYYYNDVGYASKAWYAAFEWTPSIEPENPGNIYGLKAGFEMNLQMLAVGMEAKYQAGSESAFVLTPKIGFGFMGMVNIFYGYHIFTSGNSFNKIGNDQISIAGNLNSYVLAGIGHAFSYSEADTALYNKIIIDVSAGAAIPVGSFQFYERDKTQTGFNIVGGAELGIKARIEGRYLLNKNFGFIISYSSTSNKAQTVPYDTLFPPDPIPALGGGTDISFFNYSSKSWYTKNILAGFCLQFGDAKTRFGIQLSCGSQQVQSPESRYDEAGEYWRYNQGIIGSFSGYTIQHGMDSKNFVVDGGLELQIKVIKRLGLIISADYMTSQAAFNGDSYYNYSGVNETYQYNNEGTYSVSFKKNIYLFNLNAGVSYAIK